MLSEDDVFRENEATIVDCDVLEAAKENVQPLAAGRRVTALSTLLATPHPQREAKLSATRNRLRINVEITLDDEDGDPLEAYCKLVYWTLENYPQGHTAESGLLELLEEATRVLKDHSEGRWRNDMKYLKLWLLYASYVEKPTIIYKFLIANDIGTNFALLYEEHAAVLERDGRRKEADGAYALGVARKADPLDHLESRYQDFQKRMMSNASIPISEPAQPSQAPRPALTTTLAAPSTSAQASGPATSFASTLNSNGRIQIFMDPTGAEAAEAVQNTWQDLGTRKTRIKENVPEVKKLVGTTIRQAGRSKRLASGASSATGSSSTIVPFRDPIDMPSPAVPASKQPPKTPAKGFLPFVDGQDSSSSAPTPCTPKFVPFRDEDDITSPRAVAIPVGEPVIKIKKSGMKAPAPTSEAEALRRDPLKNYPVDDIGRAGGEGSWD